MKYQNVLQHSEEDCGAACLATIAKHHGRLLTLNRIREAIGTGQLGTTLLGLRQGSETLGFNTRGVRVAPAVFKSLQELPLPAIIHWRGYHWVVLYGKQGNRYIVADPAVGVRFLSQSELMEGWVNGIMLLLEPDPIHFFAQPDEKIGGIGRFLKPIRTYRGILGEALLINLVLGLLSLASPFLLEILTDDVLVRGDTDLLRGLVIAVVVMNLMSSSLSLVQSNLIAHFAQRLELGLILEFVRSLLRLPLVYFEARRSGEIASRLHDIQEINQLVSQVVIGLPSQLFIALVSLGLMLVYSWKLTAAAIAFAGLMLLTTVLLLPRLRQKVRTVLVLDAENQGILVETFKGALTLKTTAAAPQFWEEYQMRFGRLANVTFRTMQIAIINNISSKLVSNISTIALLWLGSTLVISRELSIGQLLAFNSMNTNLVMFITMMIGFVDQAARVQAAAQRLSEVIDATPEVKADDKRSTVTLPGNAPIVCTNLTFHYPGRTELLEDFSLMLPGGKVIVLMGKSGCGKSTLVKLLAGLYQPRSGNIRVGQYNLPDLALDCVRQQVVLVPQDSHFWSRSIVENFRLGAPQATFEQIVTACQLAVADEFISQLPDKYQTILGEFGANLSGGQRQRLAIARALINDPPILILDESTANLDPESETQVLDNLFAHRRGKTTILISHRPQITQRADWVVMLERGQVQWQGAAQELAQLEGKHLQ
jgi:ATP-binding cassette, subfamily C, bacterial